MKFNLIVSWIMEKEQLWEIQVTLQNEHILKQWIYTNNESLKKKLESLC